VALSNIPSNNCQSESEAFFDFVKQQQGSFQLFRMPLVEGFLSEKRMGLAVSEISGR